MGYTKVFAGNLSFRTKEDQLAEQFATAGKVVSANIITRGPRSLGYGFVEFDSEEEARSAVTLLNKKNIDGREINVEIAKPREEKQFQQPQQQTYDQPPRRRGGFRGRGRGRGGYSQSPSNNNNNPNNQAPDSPASQQPQAQSGDAAPRAPRPKRAPRNFNRDGQQAPNQGQPGQQQQNQNQGQEGENSPPQSGEFSRRGGRGGRGRGGRGRGGRGGRGRGRGYYNANRPPRPQSVESTTSLFVANLPFDLDDAKLLELFKDHKAVSAHVVTNFHGRSRGFGFVEFAENDQRAAFEATNENKIVANNRPLTVKIALIEEKQNPAETPEGEVSSQAPVQQN